MAAAPTIPLITVEEYLNTSYKPECEYVDGVLEPKALPSPPHSLFHHHLTRYLYAFEESHGFLVLSELRIAVSTGRHRVPDIALMPTAWLNDRTVIALATFEILSPDERMSRVVGTVRDQHSLGISHILVVDPQERALFIANEKGLLEGIDPARITLSLPDRPPIAIDFAELFAQVPQR